MKKVTLSAAILALSMMGCSDVGLDNSVASTNEVKKEAQDQNFLAKMQPEGVIHRGLYVYDYQSMGGPTIHVNTYLDPFSNACIGEYWNASLASKPADFADVITVAVAGCSFRSNGVFKCDQHRANHGFGPDGNHNIADNVVVKTPVLGGPRELIGVVSAFGAVWNSGKPNQDVFNATAYNGYLNDAMAYEVYKKYVLQAANNVRQNLSCIDYVPGETPCNK